MPPCTDFRLPNRYAQAVLLVHITRWRLPSVHPAWWQTCRTHATGSARPRQKNEGSGGQNIRIQPARGEGGIQIPNGWTRQRQGGHYHQEVTA